MRDPFYYYVFWGFPGGSVVKNPPANQETQVRSLGQEDTLEKKIQPFQSSFLRKHMDREAWWAAVYGVAKESDNSVTKQQQQY